MSSASDTQIIQLDHSEPTVIKGGILGVLLGLSGAIDIVVRVGLLKFKDYLNTMAHRHNILLYIIGG
jgi:hypothetical protein